MRREPFVFLAVGHEGARTEERQLVALVLHRRRQLHVRDRLLTLLAGLAL
jgi:hypothetical protein